MTDRRWHGGSLLYELKDEGDPIEKNEFGILWHHRRVAVVHPRIAPGKGHGRRGQEDGRTRRRARKWLGNITDRPADGRTMHIPLFSSSLSKSG